MHLLVLNASELNLGFLGCYGNAWVATPHLDSLAAESVVFDQHFAENLTQPAGSWSSSLAQSIAANDANLCIHLAASDGTTLNRIVKHTLSALKQLTRRSSGLCWVDLPSLYPPWTVEEEFLEDYLVSIADDEDQEEVEEPALEPLLDPPIGEFDAKDLLLWDRLRGAYAGAVTQLDTGLGKLFEQLRDRDLYDKLVIAFTADRGLALGEHGIAGDCRPWLHDEAVHLPLITKLPNQAEAGRHMFGLSQPNDLAATLLELVGQTPQNGHSLMPLMHGEVESIRDRCMSRWVMGEAEERSLRTIDSALLVPINQPDDWPTRPVQFYLKPEDRWEVNNVIQHHLDLADELEKTLRATAV